MDSIFQDLRYAVRTLMHAPAFTLAATATLALGIGANVSIFSLVYGVVVKPLPYRDPGRLIVVRAEENLEGARGPLQQTVPPQQFAAWRGPLPGIESTALVATEIHALAFDAGTEVVNSAVVSASFFSTIGGPLEAGRPLEPSDDASPVVVIGDALARRLFAEPSLAIGKSLTLTSRPYTVVGVAAPLYQFPARTTDVWVPAGFAISANERCCGFRVVARLAPGESLERARASAEAVFASSEDGRASKGALRVTAVSLQDDIVATTRPALLMLFAAVLLVLVIACANLVNLLLARNAAREREFAIRRSMGASRGRLVRQVLVETALVAFAGAAAGVLLAGPVIAGLAELASSSVPRADAIHLDAAALLFAASLACFAVMATGVLPALNVGSADALAHRSTTTASIATRRLHRALCIAQVALAVTLLVGAMLLGRSLTKLLRTDLGVRTDHVLTASLNMGFGQRPPDAETLTRVKRVLERVRALPGVLDAGAGTSVPPANSRIRLTLRREGDSVNYQASAVPVTPGYFSTLHMRLVQGRFFNDSDDSDHPQVMIMNQDTARRFFGDGDPIGQTMSLPHIRDGKTTSVRMTLVGIVANVKYSGLAAPPDDAVYRPFDQQPWVAPFLVVRTSGNPEDLSATLRRAIGEADSAAVMASVTTLESLVADGAAQPEFRTVLLVSLAGLALAMACVGLYGVVAYAVSRRTREIGIRIALGAPAGRVMRMILSDGMGMALAGVGIGIAGAVATSRLLAGLLYGIEPTDPVSFVLAAATLLGVTLAASYIPARRAAGVDPIETLRAE